MKKLFIVSGIIGGLSLFSTSCQPEIITPVDQIDTDSTEVSNLDDSTNVNSGEGSDSNIDSTIVIYPGDSTNSNNNGSGWNLTDSLDNNDPSTDSLSTGG